MNRTGKIILFVIILIIVFVPLMMYYQLSRADSKYKKALLKAHDYNNTPPTKQYMTTEINEDGGIDVKVLPTREEDWSEEFKKIKDDKKYLKHKAIRIFILRDLLKNHVCTGSDLQKNKPLNNQNLFVRLTSKMFHDFCICVVDELIDVILSKIDKDEVRMFCIFYDKDILRILAICTYHEKEMVGLCKNLKISAGNEDTCAIFFGLMEAISSTKPKKNKKKTSQS